MPTFPHLPTPFEPVPVRPRRDGWTPDRQIAFIEKLAECGSVSAAAKSVGMTRESARQLARRPCGRAFRDAMDAALDCSYAEVEDSAAERSRKGVARPVFYKGEQVGEWRHFDERLTMFLLRFRRRHRFGREAEAPLHLPADVPGFDPEVEIAFDPESRLDGALDGIEFAPDPPEDMSPTEDPGPAEGGEDTGRSDAA